MDILSLLLFAIYALVILVILIYISPIFSAIIMILLPVIFVVLVPDHAMTFLSIEQFSFLEGSLPVYNIHILLFVWSALIGVIAYAEFLSWYLLREAKPRHQMLEQDASLETETGKLAKLRGMKLKEFFGTVWKTLKGDKQE